MSQPVDLRVLRPPGIAPATAPSAPRRATPAGGEFAEELSRAQKRDEVVFSAHAALRLERRGIRLSDADRARLSDAVSAAESKGGRNSLVVLGQTALIVNVPSRTVVTAMGAGAANERVITNIDSAVIA